MVCRPLPECTLLSPERSLQEQGVAPDFVALARRRLIELPFKNGQQLRKLPTPV
jgi:hypothetical protein